jgi:hypothetical protein
MGFENNHTRCECRKVEDEIRRMKVKNNNLRRHILISKHVTVIKYVNWSFLQNSFNKLYLLSVEQDQKGHNEYILNYKLLSRVNVPHVIL